ncbi:hypothetical protein AMS68_007027 [Peltaster fructicola]|uniref:Uncharacterized protein n=1 Tax=Peltaster fructicola TaxID=286661 RepID=A0A6H0Y4H4_9PEZI|nr:hypothetical protein AMS68_007027 [Peltaster fructicola]
MSTYNSYHLDIPTSQEASFTQDMQPNSGSEMDQDEELSYPTVNGSLDLPRYHKRKIIRPQREGYLGPNWSINDTRPAATSIITDGVTTVSSILRDVRAEADLMSEHKDFKGWRQNMLEEFSKGPGALTRTLLKRFHLESNMLEQCVNVLVPMLSMMDQVLLESLIRGDLVHNAMHGHLGSVLPDEQAHPITYMTAVAREDGLVLVRDMQSIALRMRAFLNCIDGRSQGSSECPVLSKHVTCQETGEINYGSVRLLRTFVLGFEHRISEAQDNGNPFMQPCCTIGYTTDPSTRRVAHERRQTNKIQGCFLDVCDSVERGRYKLHFIPVVKACSLAECSWQEWALTCVAGCFIGHGHFTYYPAGRSNPVDVAAMEQIAAHAQEAYREENVRKVLCQLGEKRYDSSGMSVDGPQSKWVAVQQRILAPEESLTSN